MTSHHRIFVVAIVLLAATLLHAADAVPLGHPDFLPSPERPLGWRGDGTGAWPGANVVTSWDASTGRNIAWKVNTPGAGLCQPLVVGEKVFITADPNLLCCYSIYDGKLLWQTAIDHTPSMPAEDREKARAEQVYFDALWLQYQHWVQGFDALLDAVAVKQGIAAPTAPANLKDKEYQTKRDAWQQARRELAATVFLPGSSGFGAYLPKRDDPKGVELLRLLAGRAELQQQYAALLAEQELCYWRPECGYGGNRTRYDYKAKPEPAWMTRYKASNGKYDIWFMVPNTWYAWVTYSFSTPITDGKYMYVATANNDYEFSGRYSRRENSVGLNGG